MQENNNDWFTSRNKKDMYYTMKNDSNKTNEGMLKEGNRSISASQNVTVIVLTCMLPSKHQTGRRGSLSSGSGPSCRGSFWRSPCWSQIGKRWIAHRLPSKRQKARRGSCCTLNQRLHWRMCFRGSNKLPSRHQRAQKGSWYTRYWGCYLKPYFSNLRNNNCIVNSSARSRSKRVAGSPAGIRRLREAARAHDLNAVSSEGGGRWGEESEGGEKFHFCCNF